METIDLKGRHKEMYTAKGTPEEVAVPAGTFLAVEGVGEPGGEAYQAAIDALYGVAYTMKFALKAAGVLDFKVPNLECLWLSDPNDTPPKEWEWHLSIRVPDRITAAQVAEAVRQVEAKKGIDASVVRRTDREGGRAIQILHVGPYDTVTDSYGKLRAYAQDRGLDVEGSGVEVYLSDPRRTAPERLKTIVRMPLASAQ
jgi:hypothetical protein